MITAERKRVKNHKAALRRIARARKERAYRERRKVAVRRDGSGDA